MKLKIFFTATRQGKEIRQSVYDRIVRSIEKTGEEVISLEAGKYEDYLGKKFIKSVPKDKLHYIYVRKGINMANAVIIENSDESFQLGHEATLALVYNKPLLCLAKEDPTSRVKIFDTKLKMTFYKSENEIDAIVADFISEVRNNSLSVRFNAKLSPIQKNFLDWYAQKTQRTGSQIFRDSIDKMIEDHPEFLDDLDFTPNNT